jgi:nicotinamidase-related amidase
MQLTIEADPYAWPYDGMLAPDNTALVIIDMQRDFCAPAGYLGSLGGDVSGIRRIIPNILAVRGKIRDWGGLVIYTREGHRPDLSDLPPQKAWRSRRAGLGIGAMGPEGRLLVRGERGCEIIEELAPGPNELTVDKPGYSAFYATDLARILDARRIRNLILTGVTTDVCVHSTLREAVDRGFECLTIEDGCAASVPENHAAAIRTITTEGGIFGAVTTTDRLTMALTLAGAAS